jgi:hypothetical protein
MGGIEDQFELMTRRDPFECVDCARIAVHVDGNDGRRPPGNSSFDVGGVDGPGIGVTIGKYGSQAVPNDSVSGAVATCELADTAPSG